MKVTVKGAAAVDTESGWLSHWPVGSPLELLSCMHRSRGQPSRPGGGREGVECCARNGGHLSRHQLLLQTTTPGGRRWKRLLCFPVVGQSGDYDWRD